MQRPHSSRTHSAFSEAQSCARIKSKRNQVNEGQWTATENAHSSQAAGGCTMHGTWGGKAYTGSCVSACLCTYGVASHKQLIKAQPGMGWQRQEPKTMNESRRRGGRQQAAMQRVVCVCAGVRVPRRRSSVHTIKAKKSQKKRALCGQRSKVCGLPDDAERALQLLALWSKVKGQRSVGCLTTPSARFSCSHCGQRSKVKGLWAA